MNNVKKLRADNNVKQSDLAKHLQVAQSTLSYWEKGKYDIDNESIQKIAKYFNVSTDYVLGYANSENTSNSKALLVDEELYHLIGQIKSRPILRSLLETAIKASYQDVEFVFEMLKRLVYPPYSEIKTDEKSEEDVN